MITQNAGLLSPSEIERIIDKPNRVADLIRYLVRSGQITAQLGIRFAEAAGYDFGTVLTETCSAHLNLRLH